MPDFDKAITSRPDGSLPSARGRPDRFDPLTRSMYPLGEIKIARDARTKRMLAEADAAWMAKHFQLTEDGKLDPKESAQLTAKERAAKYKRLTDFPRIPPGELDRLERIIAQYGLPLAALSSDIAAFVLRRVLIEYHRLTTLHRRTNKGLFTPEELLELLTVMQLKPWELADALRGGQVGTRDRHAINNLIQRWLHGVNKPNGITAIRVNSLIEQHVRKTKARAGGFPAVSRPGVARSENPDTVQRRTRRERQRKPAVAPLTKAAMAEMEAQHDAASPDPTPETPPVGASARTLRRRRAALRDLQEGGGAAPV